ncbi:hypothetical protein FKM82_006858 [Ascaphus truei]
MGFVFFLTETLLTPSVAERHDNHSARHVQDCPPGTGGGVTRRHHGQLTLPWLDYSCQLSSFLPAKG